MGCSQPATHLPIHHIILIVDVAREVGGHELVLIPAPSRSSGKSPLIKLAKRLSNKLTVTQGNCMTRQLVKSQLWHKPALLAQPTDSVLHLSPHPPPLPTSASPLAARQPGPMYLQAHGIEVPMQAVSQSTMLEREAQTGGRL